MTKLTISPPQAVVTPQTKEGVLIRRRKKKGQSGNALSHGLQSATGLLPVSARHIARRRNAACKKLQLEIIRVHRREPSWFEEQCINEYRTWFTLKELIENWLSIASSGLMAGEIIGYQRRAASAATQLRSITERLGLNQGNPPVFIPSQGPLTDEEREKKRIADEAAHRLAAESNREAIRSLRLGEMNEQAIKAFSGENLPPSMFPPVEAGPVDAGTNADLVPDTSDNHANGRPNSHVGLPVDFAGSDESQSGDLVAADTGDEIDA